MHHGRILCFWLGVQGWHISGISGFSKNRQIGYIILSHSYTLQPLCSWWNVFSFWWPSRKLISLPNALWHLQHSNFIILHDSISVVDHLDYMGLYRSSVNNFLTCARLGHLVTTVKNNNNHLPLVLCSQGSHTHYWSCYEKNPEYTLNPAVGHGKTITKKDGIELSFKRWKNVHENRRSEQQFYDQDCEAYQMPNWF